MLLRARGCRKQVRQVNGYNARRAICRRAGGLFLRADAEYTKLLF